LNSKGFAPLSNGRARVLILGTLPGQMSLERREYYAKPQNGFWRIMDRLFDAGPALPYARRIRHLMKHGVAVWDVCESAHRPGSLDAAIAHATVVPNDFAGFLSRHRQLKRICFNGAKAAALYERLVLPGLGAKQQEIERVTLPSTSPAHAAMSFNEKLQRWRAGLRMKDFE
jgi:double-stranded uracil-DNA glycosylase